MTTAYDLPFEVRYTNPPLFASGRPVDLIAELRDGGELGRQTLDEVVKLFTDLGGVGAFAGGDRDLASREFQLEKTVRSPPSRIAFRISKPLADDRALLVLSHMLMARRKELPLRTLQILSEGPQTVQILQHDSDILSTYPPLCRKLPFPLTDEEPESGAYTFTAMLEQPLTSVNLEWLEMALKLWTQTVLGGGYGLAPIPPEECYVEPSGDCVTTFDRTVEWIVFKLRADPACIHGLVNIFAALHYRGQKVLSFTIS